MTLKQIKHIRFLFTVMSFNQIYEFILFYFFSKNFLTMFQYRQSFIMHCTTYISILKRLMSFGRIHRRWDIIGF